jgi:hypothetical protein
MMNIIIIVETITRTKTINHNCFAIITSHYENKDKPLPRLIEKNKILKLQTTRVKD